MGASEDTFKEITYADLAAAANEGDLDGDALSFRIDAISSGTLEKWSGSAWVGVTAGSTLLTTGEKLQWKAGANATGTLNAFTVSAYDGALASAVPVPVRVSVMAENDAPVRTSAAPSAISVAEDSNNTTPISLGLSSLVYGTGGGSDETSQSLSYTITGIPAFIDVFKSDGTTQITVNDSLTLGELQGLKFKTLANANGSGLLSWQVRDDGGTARGGVDLLSQSLTVRVNAVNDVPVNPGFTILRAEHDVVMKREVRRGHVRSFSRSCRSAIHLADRSGGCARSDSLHRRLISFEPPARGRFKRPSTAQTNQRACSPPLSLQPTITP
jgi:hypothetical protein